MGKFVGGPCDGKAAPISVYNQTYCGGTLYTQGEDGNFYAPGKIPRFPPIPQGNEFGIPGAHRVEAAWRDMNKAFGADTQRMIRKLHRAGARMRRAGG